MKFRVVVEIDMPDGSSSDDAIVWAQKLIDTAKNRLRDPTHLYRPRIVSATPVLSKLKP